MRESIGNDTESLIIFCNKIMFIWNLNFYHSRLIKLLFNQYRFYLSIK